MTNGLTIDELIEAIDEKITEQVKALDLVLHHRIFGTHESVCECELYCKQIDAEILALEKELTVVTPDEIKEKANFIEAIQLLIGMGAAR